MSDEITLTESGAAKVVELIKAENNPNLKLRVYIEGGGCSGFQYGFAFEENVNEDDFTIECYGVTLVVDAISQQYLLGAEIDYQDDKLNGSRFIIRNPNTKGTCGCGSSFNS